MDKPDTCSILSEAMVLQENPKYISDMSVCPSSWHSTEINLMLKKQAGFDCVHYVSLAAESLLTASKLKALCTQIKIICMKIKKAHYIYNETWLLT